MGDILLFEDIFIILQLDFDGKKFDKVLWIVVYSEQFDMDVLLDVNIDIYFLYKGEKFILVFVFMFSLDGIMDDGMFDQSNCKLLVDKYEYVMYGKVYKYVDMEFKGFFKVEIYVLFGGLLMCFKGDFNNLNSLVFDQCVYLFMWKVGQGFVVVYCFGNFVVEFGCCCLFCIFESSIEQLNFGIVVQV